jgi:hypothetical protein
MKIKVIRAYSGAEGVGPDKDVHEGSEHTVTRARGSQLHANGLVEILSDDAEDSGEEGGAQRQGEAGQLPADGQTNQPSQSETEHDVQQQTDTKQQPQPDNKQAPAAQTKAGKSRPSSAPQA